MFFRIILSLKLSLSIFFIVSVLSIESKSQDLKFNSYLLRAVDTVEKNWALKGYDLKGIFTHDLDFGNLKLKASARQPGTMCVAAQLELIVTALNIYAAETRDSSVFEYLPVSHWISTRTKSFRDFVWVNSGSQGTAYALNAYGMGSTCSFKELIPGSFINLNRATSKPSGHAVLFIAYIDGTGNELDKYSNEVKGFKYYSSQGSGPGYGGFGYRYAFFGDLCPEVGRGKRRDCKVIYSERQLLLNCGFMVMPKNWNKQQRDLAIAAMKKISSLSENAVNPNYLVQDTIDD